MTIGEAVEVFETSGNVEGRKMFGMMVTDEAGKIVGMLSLSSLILDNELF